MRLRVYLALLRSNLRGRWRRFKERWPVVSRRWHHRTLADRLHQMKRKHEEELERVSEGLKRLLPELVRVRYGPVEHEFGVFRCQIDFRTDFVYGGFIHGGDDYMIRYLAKQFAGQVEREIRTLNFAWADGDDTPLCSEHAAARGLVSLVGGPR